MAADHLRADTDLVDNDKLVPPFAHMSVVGERFRHVTSQNVPPGTVRGDVDRQIHDRLAVQIELVTAVIDGITRLAHGDTDDVGSWRSLLENVEDDNSDLARSGGDRVPPRH
ncbi:hypothetical protein [Plantactinospora sp. B5E13]|uniref:hypothetical protein n=1 Tax=unclassified Plantactinospora TaxID=2631981 RepID=UPI00325F41C0